MTTGTMTIEAFEGMLDAHGVNLAAWPPEEQSAAALLLRSSSKARAALEAAQALDQALHEPMPKAPAGLVDRIIAASGANKEDGST